MVELPVPRSEIDERLSKIEGQVRGIRNMVKQERDCTDILVQLSAVRSALSSVAAEVIQNYCAICLAKKGSTDAGKDLARAASIWVGGRI